jgi:hypothetical protein
MKKQFFITFLLIVHCLVIGNCQKLKTFSVTFKTAFKDSIKYSDWKGFREEFCILKDNSELPLNAYSISKNGKKIKVSGLTNGNYVVRYENIFGQLIDKSIEIKRKSIKNMPISLDEFIDTVKIVIFENMKNDDTLTIKYYISGCDGSHKEQIEFVKKNNLLESKFFDYNDLFSVENINQKTGKKIHSFEYGEPIKTLIKVKAISPNDIALIYHLFKRLYRIPDTGGMSTTQLHYTIFLNEKLIMNFYDDNLDICSFDYLKDKIFGIK